MKSYNSIKPVDKEAGENGKYVHNRCKGTVMKGAKEQRTKAR